MNENGILKKCLGNSQEDKRRKTRGKEKQKKIK